MLFRISECFSILTHLDKNIKESISPSVINFAKFALTFNLLNEILEPIWTFLNETQKEHLLSSDVLDTFDQTQLQNILKMSPYSIKHFTIDAIKKLSCSFVREISKQHPQILTTYFPDSLVHLQKNYETRAITKVNQDDVAQIDTSAFQPRLTPKYYQNKKWIVLQSCQDFLRDTIVKAGALNLVKIVYCLKLISKKSISS